MQCTACMWRPRMQCRRSTSGSERPLLNGEFAAQNALAAQIEFLARPDIALCLSPFSARGGAQYCRRHNNNIVALETQDDRLGGPTPGINPSQIVVRGASRTETRCEQGTGKTYDAIQRRSPAPTFYKGAFFFSKPAMALAGKRRLVSGHATVGGR